MDSSIGHHPRGADPAAHLYPADNVLGTAWTQPGFDDSAWISGTNGVGFNTDGTYNSVIGTNIQSPMLNASADAYIRIPFTVANPALLTGLELTMQDQDGFVAYLNGVEVARRNAPTRPGTRPRPARWQTSSAPLPPVVNFNITSKLSKLVAGTNVLAIQGLNAAQRALTSWSTRNSRRPSRTREQGSSRHPPRAPRTRPR